MVFCLTAVTLDVQAGGNFCTCFPTLGLLTPLPRLRHSFCLPYPTPLPAFPKTVFRDVLFPYLNLNIITAVIVPLALALCYPFCSGKTPRSPVTGLTCALGGSAISGVWGT